MAHDQHTNQPNKRTLRDAQARHQSALFGDQVQKPSSQQAVTESKERGAALSQAAAQKRQQLSPEEVRKLAELQARSQAKAPVRQPAPATPQPQPSAPTPQPAPMAPTTSPSVPAQPDTQLHEVAKRSDLAAEAVASMQRNLKRPAAPAQPQPASLPADQPQPAAPAPQPQSQPVPPAPMPTPQPAPQPQPPAPSAPMAPASPAPAQPAASPRPAGKRPAPTPEELDRLLKDMAQRSAARRQAGGQAPPPRPGGRGPERVDAAPVAEAPPEPAPEITAEEEKSPEKQAEILRELRSREATAQRDVKPIPQADQERAEERAVEATVPIRTEGNAVSAAPLHAAIADLQDAMRAHDAPGQVAGVNEVQRTMPNHPLYSPETRKDSHGT